MCAFESRVAPRLDLLIMRALVRDSPVPKCASSMFSGVSVGMPELAEIPCRFPSVGMTGEN